MGVHFKGLVTLGVAALISACSTVTIQTEGGAKLITEPTYEARKAFYLGGLIGESHINVKRVCRGKEPVQMQSQQTFVDGLAALVTLTIYSPRTAKIWCEK